MMMLVAQVREVRGSPVSVLREAGSVLALAALLIGGWVRWARLP